MTNSVAQNLQDGAIDSTILQRMGSLGESHPQSPLFVLKSEELKKCSTCQIRFSYWVFHKGVIAWRNCWHCQSDKERELVRAWFRNGSQTKDSE